MHTRKRSSADPRARILNALKRHGALHVARVATLAKLPWSTAADHLRELETEGLVTSRRDGRRRFYVLSRGGGDFPRELGGATARRLALAVADAPGSTARELCALTDLSRRAAYYHARALCEARLVVGVGEPMRYFARPRLERLLRLR